MNVLGIIFDTNLQWLSQVSHCIKIANKALSAIKIIQDKRIIAAIDKQLQLNIVQ
jgi:hypothetical protein